MSASPAPDPLRPDPRSPGFHGSPVGSGWPAGADPTDCIGARVAQYVLDGLVATLPAIVLFLAVSVAGYLAAFGSVNFILVLYLGTWLVAVATHWFVLAWWPSTHEGRTPAMGWLGLRIVSEDGHAPGLGRLTVRWLLLVVDALVGGLVGLIIMLTSRRHQRLGDQAAGTLVIRS